MRLKFNKSKCCDRNIVVKLLAPKGDYDRKTDNHPTNRTGHREVSLPISIIYKIYEKKKICNKFIAILKNIFFNFVFSKKS